MTQKSQYIEDLEPGTQISELFLIAAATMGQAKNGPYWNITLQDKTGSVDAKIWSPASQHYSAIEAGSIARVHGQVDTYRDKVQIRVEALDFSRASGIDLSQFLPSSKVPPEELLEALEDLITEHMLYNPWKKFCRKVLRDDEIREKLLTSPGAKTVHHAYVGGLLEHSLSVANLCMAICDIYPQLDRQTLLAGAMFHDIGKAWELQLTPACAYTDAGKLMGHIQLGLDALEPFLSKSRDLEDGLKLHFRHLITSHHGEHEFGSPVRPKTSEALMLHFADNMDAKMNIMDAAYADMDKAGQDWSPFLRFMDRDIFQPTRTPDPKNGKSKKANNQCLLPLKA